MRRGKFSSKFKSLIRIPSKKGVANLAEIDRKRDGSFNVTATIKLLINWGFYFSFNYW